MSYTITNNIMYIRNKVGELVPVSMIASSADQTIQAIKNTAAEAESQIDTKVADANVAIEAKTDEQAARIPEVTTLAEDVNGLKGDVVQLAEDMTGKLTEPAEGLAVGKYFRIAALDKNGHSVLEAVEAPVGQQGIQGVPGADGHTPVKGTDYFTEEDKAEMVNAVLAALPAAEGVSY